MIPSSGIQLDLPKIDEVYRCFAALAAVNENPGGLLLLYSGLDTEGIATVMAANVAGVASLGLEPDAALAKLALRAGGCDFVVNSLDEGLRILKNEVRQHRAASVVVTEAMEPTVAEIVARGVQPDISTLAVPELIERGAKMLPTGSCGEADEMEAVTWSVQREPMRWLPVLDALAMQAMNGPAVHPWKVRWLEASPRYLGRMFAGQRYIQMTAAGADRFAAAVESAVKAGQIQVAVQLVRNGKVLLIES
jgi:Urocanase Rossmann-like domain